MPFDPAPQVTETQTGRFAAFADAMLRGCAVTKPYIGFYFSRDRSAACAIGAMWVGMGIHNCPARVNAEEAVESAYLVKYGTRPQDDNDSEAFTREQIAERIRAL